MSASHIGESVQQYMLHLRSRVVVPWKGVSPRALTRGAQLIILKAQDVEDIRAALHPEQMEFMIDGRRL